MTDWFKCVNKWYCSNNVNIIMTNNNTIFMTINLVAALKTMQAIRIIKVNTLTMGTTGLYETFIPNSVYTQCVRWKRKPIWLPTAKTKVFRVPKRPVIPIEDSLELKRLYNNYRTYMTSLRWVHQMYLTL